MNDFINWLVDNWKFVSTCAISIVSFILLLVFKRRPSIRLFGDTYYKCLITFINEAEAKFGAGHGGEKLNYVLNRFSAEFGSWTFQVMADVESLLSTPQKKGK